MRSPESPAPFLHDFLHMTRTTEQELRLVVCVAAVGWAACGGAVVQRDVPAREVIEHRAAPAPHTDYVVRPGESLSRIAACSGVSVAYLAETNRISDPNLIVAGARLHLPRGNRCVGEDAALGVARARASLTLTAATARLDAADFEKALSLAEICVRGLAPYGADTAANEIRARCHVVAGTAAAGLARRERAIDEFRSAFALDPHLELASGTTSPRILELVSEARPASSSGPNETH